MKRRPNNNIIHHKPRTQDINITTSHSTSEKNWLLYLPCRCIADCKAIAPPSLHVQQTQLHPTVTWLCTEHWPSTYEDMKYCPSPMYLYKQRNIAHHYIQGEGTTHCALFINVITQHSHNSIQLEKWVHLVWKLSINIAHYTQNTAYTMHIWLRNTHTGSSKCTIHSLFLMQAWKILYGRMEFVYSRPPM